MIFDWFLFFSFPVYKFPRFHAELFLETFGEIRRIIESYHITEGGNLAASKIRNLECPSYEICLIDYGCGKFNRKIHIMEQYP